MAYQTINVKPETKAKLLAIGRKDQTFDEIINALITKQTKAKEAHA